MAFPWGERPEAFEFMSARLAETKSAGQVAKLMTDKYEHQFSRNFIVGKAIRDGVPLLYKQPRGQVKRIRKPQLAKPKIEPPTITQRKNEAMARFDAASEPALTIRPFRSLKPHECKWIMQAQHEIATGDSPVCAKPCDGPYCKFHSQLAFVPSALGSRELIRQHEKRA